MVALPDSLHSVVLACIICNLGLWVIMGFAFCGSLKWWTWWLPLPGLPGPQSMLTSHLRLEVTQYASHECRLHTFIWHRWGSQLLACDSFYPGLVDVKFPFCFPHQLEKLFQTLFQIWRSPLWILAGSILGFQDHEALGLSPLPAHIGSPSPIY